MADDNELDLDSQNQDNGIAVDDNDDANALRDKFGKVSEENKKLADANRQLFARAKKAEGFELKDGKWIKPEKPPVEPKPDPKPSGKPGELDDVESLLLEVKGLKDADELGLYEKWKTDTGRPARQILNNPTFQKELTALRQEKAVLDATPNATKRGGNATNNNEDYWFAKYEQDGKLPENMPSGMAERLVNRKMAQTDVRRNPFE